MPMSAASCPRSPAGVEAAPSWRRRARRRCRRSRCRWRRAATTTTTTRGASTPAFSSSLCLEKTFARCIYKNVGVSATVQSQRFTAAVTGGCVRGHVRGCARVATVCNKKNRLRADLHNGAAGNCRGNLLPVTVVQAELVQEDGVLLVSPAPNIDWRHGLGLDGTRRRNQRRGHSLLGGRHGRRGRLPRCREARGHVDLFFACTNLAWFDRIFERAAKKQRAVRGKSRPPKVQPVCCGWRLAHHLPVNVDRSPSPVVGRVLRAPHISCLRLKRCSV